ncbi:MAG: hypothetical protein O7C59_12315 [Rickettsia endosymbiont of Ixodes persulcatus]|nr:hypothetical protein [Rickettsia endosymbiont of Ixodes persulcatus]
MQERKIDKRRKRKEYRTRIKYKQCKAEETERIRIKSRGKEISREDNIII